MANTANPTADRRPVSDAPPRRPIARPARGFVRRHPWRTGFLVFFALLLLAMLVVRFAVAEPLRRTAEQRMNDALDGYRVRIGGLSLNILGLGVDLLDLEIVQTSRPEPPVAWVDRFGASIQWRALLSGEVVGDLVIVEPRLYLDLQHVRAEAADERPLDERGWQEAVQAIYPLEINALQIRNGSITYDDASDVTPVHVTDLDLVARNIRNVTSDPGTFPSPVSASALVFEKGRVRFDGAADLLAKPQANVQGEIALDDMPLAPLTAAARTWGIELAGGTLSADGRFEVTAKKRQVDLASVTLDGVRADLIKAGASGARGEEAAQKTVRGATDPDAAPEVVVHVDEFRLKKGELGYVDGEADPSYRLFVSKLDVTVHDFTNEKRKGARPGRAAISGAFMGSGAMKLDATFQPAKTRAEFSSNLEITDVELVTLNNLLRARGGLDVNAGRFSLFSEIAVREGTVEGYVKPIFADLDVYDLDQDSDKNIFRQAYEGIVGGIGTLLENRPRDEVATRTDLSGRIESPQTSTWEIIIGLVQNAFVRAILPGLDRGADGD